MSARAHNKMLKTAVLVLLWPEPRPKTARAEKLDRSVRENTRQGHATWRAPWRWSSSSKVPSCVQCLESRVPSKIW